MSKKKFRRKNQCYVHSLIYRDLLSPWHLSPWEQGTGIARYTEVSVNGCFILWNFIYKRGKCWVYSTLTNTAISPYWRFSELIKRITRYLISEHRFSKLKNYRHKLLIVNLIIFIIYYLNSATWLSWLLAFTSVPEYTPGNYMSSI